MEIKPSPLPGWAWDLIETVERGERRVWNKRYGDQLVQEITWTVTRRTPYDKMIAKAESGTIRASRDTTERALGQWRDRSAMLRRETSGVTQWEDSRIRITAGTEVLDQRMVLLHELAHLLAPERAMHSMVWARIAARLYRKYGGPEIVAWAIAHERNGRGPIKRLLRTAS